jgi:DNA processing protein
LTAELKYQLALIAVPNIGPILSKILLQHLGSARDIMTAKYATLLKIEGVGAVRAKAIVDFDSYNEIVQEIKFIEQHQITCLFYQDDAYPTRLKQCVDAPILIFFKGNNQLNATKIISVIGRRKNTEYGRKLTEELIETIAPFNPIIISGLALGIDIIAHKAALQHNLQTVGVLAHGLDRIYPPQHRNTAKEMLEHGGLLTEYISGTNPDKQNFPMRNRIVAGLSDATIVVETDVKGGSMITANLANSYNREVMAYPGSIYSNASSGCHQLIKTLKAHIITDGNDLIELLGWEDNIKTKKTPQRELFIELEPNEKIIYNLLHQHELLSIDEITFYSQLPPSLIAAATLGLEMQNIIVMQPGKVYKLL